jgi:D-alanine-D-alanine ligase-like ATP-grasp enzyme
MGRDAARTDSLHCATTSADRCPDEAAADRLVLRLRGFLEWLATRSGVRGVTLEQAGEILTAVDVVFPILHGPYGEDGTIQGLLERAGLDASALVAVKSGNAKRFLGIS